MGRKFQSHSIHESISQAMKSLRKAQKIAEYNRDMEAMIAISERWMVLIQKLDELDANGYKMVGFTQELIQGDMDVR